MEGIITVKTKEGEVFQGNLWEVICLLFFQNEYVLIQDVIEIGIDGFGVSKPKIV